MGSCDDKSSHRLEWVCLTMVGMARTLLAFILSFALALSGSWATVASAMTAESQSCCCERMQAAEAPKVSCAKKGCGCEAHAPATAPSESRLAKDAGSDVQTLVSSRFTAYAIPTLRRSSTLAPQLPRPPPQRNAKPVYLQVCAYLI